jgi:hypothetical protein
MKGSVKVFLDAARETPRLYFAPLVEALQTASKIQDQMSSTGRGGSSEFGKFEVKHDRAHHKAR